MALALVALTSRAGAEQPPVGEERFQIAAHAGVAFGTAVFAPAFALGNGISGLSRLEWPLKGPYVGGAAAIAGRTARGNLWGLRFSLGGTLADPWSAVVDQDWVALGNQSIEFSHTDSVVRGRAIYTELAGRFGTRWSEWGGGATSVFCLFGVRYEHSVLDAIGADGWQLDERMVRQPVSAPSDLQVGHFTAERVLPYVGLGVRVGGRRLMSDFEISPLLAIVSDTDDHVYRHKIGSALSTGGGVLLRVAPRLRLNPGAVGISVVLGIDLEYRYLRANGTLKQHYYADDPGLPGDQLAISIPTPAPTCPRAPPAPPPPA